MHLKRRSYCTTKSAANQYMLFDVEKHFYTCYNEIAIVEYTITIETEERVKMEKHIQEFTVHAYKGIHDLKLENLNLINILTGDNNSGKTSVLELLSTLGNPQNTDAWVLCARTDNLRTRNRLYFNGFYNMFPIDHDTKNII